MCPRSHCTRQQTRDIIQQWTESALCVTTCRTINPENEVTFCISCFSRLTNEDRVNCELRDTHSIVIGRDVQVHFENCANCGDPLGFHRPANNCQICPLVIAGFIEYLLAHPDDTPHYCDEPTRIGISDRTIPFT